MNKGKHLLNLFLAIHHIDMPGKVIIGNLNILAIGLSCLMVLNCTAQEETSTNRAVDLKVLILEEDMRIPLDHPEVLPGSFSGIAVDDENIIYAADTRLNKIHLFSPNGSYIESLGQSGEGPGEFIDLDPHIRIEADTLYVKDSSNYRINMFSLETRQPAGTMIIPNESINGVSMGQPRDMLPLPDGYLLISFVNPYIFPPEESEPLRMTTLSLIDKSGAFSEKNFLQIPTPFPTDQKLAYMNDSGMSVFSDLYFYPDNRIAANSEGQLYIGKSDSLRIKMYGRQGELRDTLQWDYEPAPFTNSDFDSLSADKGELFNTAINETGPPDFWPIFQDFFFDDHDRLWIELINPKQPVKTWWVFSENGEPEWKADLPENMDLFVVKNNQAYGVLLSEEDVPVIVRYNIIPWHNP